MNRDDILRMAREAGWTEYSLLHAVESQRLVCFAALVAAEKDKQIAFLKDSHDAIRELAYKTGAQDEREACARLLDDQWFRTQSECAAAIRARGEK